MIEEIKAYVERNCSLAALSLAEGDRVKRYMVWLINEVSFSNCDHTCFTEGCDCNPPVKKFLG
jgi:hypothetical protein